MATQSRTPAAKKAAVPSPAPVKAEPKDRTMHLLVRRVPADGPIVELEPFSGELAARRALDSRPTWGYLGLRPGSSFAVEAVATDG